MVHIDTIAMVASFNPLRPTQNGRRFTDDTSNRIFLNDNVSTSIKISLKFIPKGPINNIMNTGSHQGYTKKYLSVYVFIFTSSG